MALVQRPTLTGRMVSSHILVSRKMRTYGAQGAARSHIDRSPHHRTTRPENFVVSHSMKMQDARTSKPRISRHRGCKRVYNSRCKSARWAPCNNRYRTLVEVLKELILQRLPRPSTQPHTPIQNIPRYPLLTHPCISGGTQHRSSFIGRRQPRVKSSSANGAFPSSIKPELKGKVESL